LVLIYDLLYGQAYQFDAKLAADERGVDVAGDKPIGGLTDYAEALAP
jgi:hypothetical protein